MPGLWSCLSDTTLQAGACLSLSAAADLAVAEPHTTALTSLPIPSSSPEPQLVFRDMLNDKVTEQVAP